MNRILNRANSVNLTDNRLNFRVKFVGRTTRFQQPVGIPFVNDRTNGLENQGVRLFFSFSLRFFFLSHSLSIPDARFA